MAKAKVDIYNHEKTCGGLMKSDFQCLGMIKRGLKVF
jgi:hypothetical protein